jgi:hypothetical protein
MGVGHDELMVIIPPLNESCIEDLAFSIMLLLSSFSPPNVSSWPGRSSYVLLPTGAVSGHRAYLMLSYHVCRRCFEALQSHG